MDQLPGILLKGFAAEPTEHHAAETTAHHDEEHHGDGEHHALGMAVFFYVGLTLLVMGVFMAIARKGITRRAPKSMATKLAEHVYFFIERVAISIIGPHGKKYITFLTTLWMFIFVSNVLGLFMSHAATGNLGVNFGLAVVTMLYVQWEGIKSNGLVGHFKHFAGPKMGGMLVFISILLFIVEIVSELAKFGSLTLRLFANIEGGHLVVQNIDRVAGELPAGGLLIVIKLLTAIVQAFVWIMLTSVYLSLVTHHDEAHADDHDHGHAPAAAHA